MIAVYLLLLLPLSTFACFCPSCGCTCCSGYSNYYSGGRGGYNYAPQSQQSYGYGAPYTIIYQQPIPVANSVPNSPIPIGGGSIPRSPLPPPPGYASPSISNPTVIHPQISEPIPPPRPSYPSDSYDFPALPKSRGYQPPRQVESLPNKPLGGYSPGVNPPSPPVTEAPVSFDFTTDEPLAHYTGTTRVVPAKKGAHNKDFEYYYVYYDDDGTGKKKSGDIKKAKMNDGSVSRRHDSVDKKKNEIDEYDFDENWTHPATTTSATTTEFKPPPAIVVTQAAPPPPPPPPPPPVTIAPIQPSSLVPSDPQDVDAESDDANYEDVAAPFGTTIQNVKYDPTTEATPEEVEWTTSATTITTTTTTTTTTPTPTTVAIVTLAPVVETTSVHRLPQNVEPAVTESKPEYEYEEYEVEEIQVVNEDGKTETITRIITTTRPSVE